MLSSFLQSKIKNKALFSDLAYIGGNWCKADNNEEIEVINPATGEVIATVPAMGKNETRRAIELADTAYASWKKTLPKDRANILRKWYNLVLENKDDLVNIMVAENGKPIKDAIGEFNYAAGFIEWFAEEAKRIHGDIYPEDRPHHRYLGKKEPIGVVAAITPWNFPYAMITRKAAPAIAAGCAVVLKPSEETPLCALALAKLAEQAGLPAGVLNIITGNPKEIGEEFTTNEIVKKLSFTGSTKIGKLLYSQCSSTVKKLSLELGGNAPCIIFEDANIDLAVDGVIAAKSRNTGQSCTNINRVFVHKAIAENFTKKLVERYSKLKVGEGFEPTSDQGPLINKKSVKKIDHLITSAVKAGAKILYQSSCPKNGSYYPLTIITVPSCDLEIHNEEIFGPVIALYEFSSDDEVLQKANSTKYGLAAYFYSNDRNRTWLFTEKLQFGMVGINESLLSTNEFIPFGGIKESGFGTEGSKYGIEEFLKIKYYCIGDI